MIDPRTKDAIRNIPVSLAVLTERVEILEKLIIDIHKFTRSTNESVVRKYGKGKKNTVAKIMSEKNK